ncbi:LLM class flavin-dependent oxidoreductase [Metabacillus sp. JX24]|uniref:LLM class flavin-dependent oxidoreductase n=1 Tax=Metabacillus sp. JX24 TaxID=3240759 RepID=UPI00350EEC9D
MKLSILDQSPISSGSSAGTALRESARLARAAEKMGYYRYWIAEHHDMPGLACPAPEIMLSYIGAETEKIRIGAGAVLLPHYKPYKVAETFHMLSVLFPGRIDLGIGRAPGGSAEATMALSDNFLENVRTMPHKFKELLHFIHGDFPAENFYSSLKAAPVPGVPPEVWLLGTSIKSGRLAAQTGTAYAFGEFMSDKDGVDMLREYKTRFQPKYELKQPKSLLTVSAICADSTEKAKELAGSLRLWKIQQLKGITGGIPSVEEAKSYTYSREEREMLQSSEGKLIAGNPAEVKRKLIGLAGKYGVNEIMIVTITHSYEDRLRSYELIANEMGEMMT